MKQPNHPIPQTLAGGVCQKELSSMIPSIEPHSKLDEFSKIAKKILFQVSQNQEQLRKLILEVPENEKLFSLSAHYEAVDKLVLWNSEDQKMQVRLHIYSDRINRQIASSQIDIAHAHNHRWNFCSLILSGGYHQAIYSIDHARDDPSMHQLIPVMIRQENIGACYTLHHSQYHSIIEEPNTVTLIVRGPIEKESFQVISEEAGKIKRQDVSSKESMEEKSQEKMSDERYQELIDKLVSLKII